MSMVFRKRPVDVRSVTLDFVSYMTADSTIASVATEVIGELDDALTVASTAIDGASVAVRLSGGTAQAIYQVYVTATMSDGLVKRLQFEIDMEGQAVPA